MLCMLLHLKTHTYTSVSLSTALSSPGNGLAQDSCTGPGMSQMYQKMHLQQLRKRLRQCIDVCWLSGASSTPCHQGKASKHRPSLASTGVGGGRWEEGGSGQGKGHGQTSQGVSEWDQALAHRPDLTAQPEPTQPYMDLSELHQQLHWHSSK